MLVRKRGAGARARRWRGPRPRRARCATRADIARNLQLFAAPCRTRSARILKYRAFSIGWRSLAAAAELLLLRSVLLRSVLLRTTRRADRLASAPTPGASAISSCQATRTSIGPVLRPTLFISATYVTVLNKQVRQCSMARLLQLLRFRPRTALPAVTALRMERRRNSFHRVQSWHHTWYVTTGASQLDAPYASCCMCVHRHCGCAVRSRLCTAAQCLRMRWIRRTLTPFTAPSVMGALCLAACVVKGRKPTRRISARFRRLGRFPVAAATRAHTPAPLPQQALRTSMRSVGYSILAFVPCCAMWDRC